jgi:hypothetical protein
LIELQISILKIKKVNNNKKRVKHLCVKVLIKSMKALFVKQMDKLKFKNLNLNLSTRIKDIQVHHPMKMKIFYKEK